MQVFFIYLYISYSLCVVRRVHWLRARAQLMRWQEEVTLTGYEMQWTVRYFLYMSRKWVLKFDGHSLAPGGSSETGNDTGIGTGTGTGHSPGAIAYSNRKHAIWKEIMNKADCTYKRCNPAYDSPL